MSSINSITFKDVKLFNDEQLTEILKHLLETESRTELIKFPEIDVALNITTGDGGEDGRIEWNDCADRTKNIPHRFSFFQCKATVLPPKECYSEICISDDKGSKSLKSQVQEVIDENGCYILFTNQALNKKQKSKRIDRFHSAISDCGFKIFPKKNICIYDAVRIATWINEYTSAVIIAKEFIGRPKPINFLSFETFTKYIEPTTNFVANENIAAHFDLIKNQLLEKNWVRLIGHSGLGKTRLIHEFLGTDDFYIRHLKSQSVYLDLGATATLEQLISFMGGAGNQEGLLIIDNCNESNHSVIIQLQRITNFKIITVDFDSSNFSGDYIKLDRSNQESIVRGIITERLSHLGVSGQQIETLVSKCEGYPSMAILICDSIEKKNDLPSLILPEQTISKLIFDREEKNVMEYELIMACSIFSKISFESDGYFEIIGEKHRAQIVEQTNLIIDIFLEGKVSYKDFHRICKKFLRKQVMEHRGGYIFVKPSPLAIELATHWWIDVPASTKLEILKRLETSNLLLFVCERLKALDRVDSAKETVERLWGRGRPFATAEVLNTSMGSLLFRHVVEVNPIACTDTLISIFSNKNESEILQFREGRRNIVWALEKLVFRKETFFDAALILLKLSISENEDIGNNSTAQFCHLFNIHLAGTEATLEQRIEVIEYLFNLPDNLNWLKIKVFSTSLNTHHFSRMGGAEKQGTKVLLDYRPTGKQIYTYFQSNIERLEKSIRNNSVIASDLLEEFSNKLRGLIGFGCLQEVTKIIRLAHKEGFDLVNIINSLRVTLEYEKLTEKEKQDIHELIKQMAPKDLKGRLSSLIVKPEWVGTKKDGKGRYIDQPKLNAERLAKEVAGNIEEIYSILEIILTGEQRQAYNFGVALIKEANQQEELLKKSIDIFKGIPSKAANADFIGGLFAGLSDNSIREQYLDKVAVEKTIKHFTFYFTKVSDYNLDDFDRLFNLLDEGLDITYFLNFKFGGNLIKLTPADFVSITNRIEKYGLRGQWVALALYFMYSFIEKERWDNIKGNVKELLESNLIVNTQDLSFIDPHNWQASVEKFLKEDCIDETFVKNINNQILDFCGEREYNYRIDTYIKNLYYEMVSNHFEIIWPDLANRLMQNDYIFNLHITSMIGGRNGNWGYDGVLFKNKDNYEIIYEWCEGNNDGQRVIAKMMPISSKNEDEKIIWHWFTDRFLQMFGDDESVLNELGANMGSFGWTGSIVSYYQMHLDLFNQIIDGEYPLMTKKWAQGQIAGYEKKIKYEKFNDERDELI